MSAREARKLWIEALRSGEYKQTQGVLCNLETGGFCCLGVACEVYQKSVLPKDRMIVKEKLVNLCQPDVPSKLVLCRSYGNDKELDTSNTGSLPEKVKEWLGIDSHTGALGGESEVSRKYPSLMAANDAGEDFNTIADYIEQDLLTLA
jgi:hypothetical protein